MKGYQNSNSSDLETLLENLHVSMYRTNPKGDFLRANHATVDLFGCKTLEELLSTSIKDYYQDLSQREKIINELENKGFLGELLPLKKKNGEPLYILTTAVAKYYETKEPSKIEWIDVASLDITERFEIEQTLKESEQKYKNLVENAKDGIVIIQDEIIRFLNPQLAKILGHPIEDIIDKKVTNFVTHQQFEDSIEIFLGREAGEEVPSASEREIVNPDGTRKNVEIRGTAIEYKGKSAFIAIIRDVTSRYLAESQIKELSELYSSVLDNSIDGITTIDYDGNIIYTNDAFEKLTKYEENYLQTLNFAEIALGTDFVSSLIKACQKGEKIINLESTLIPRNCASVPVSISAGPIKDHDSIIVITRDLRQRKVLNEEIQLFRKYSVAHIYTALFKVGDMGPEPVLTEDLPFIEGSENELLNEILMKVGYYYSPALGQGNTPSVGLFGPLPIPDVTDYLGIAHSFFINDKSNADPRCEGKSYSFLVFFVPKKLTRLFTNRERISNIIEENLKRVNEIDEIDLSFFKNLKEHIFELE